MIGVSPDPIASHVRFRDKHGLPFTLLSDPDHEVAEAYGVWVEKSMYGRRYMGVERSTFVIGPDGTLLQALYKVKPKGHAASVLDLVGATRMSPAALARAPAPAGDRRLRLPALPPGPGARPRWWSGRSRCRTPFPVEYGRASRRWNGGPVLVPHPRGGSVEGALLLLADGVELGAAVELLAAREGLEGARGVVQVEVPGDRLALAASLPRNLPEPDMTPDALARRAIDSARGARATASPTCAARSRPGCARRPRTPTPRGCWSSPARPRWPRRSGW